MPDPTTVDTPGTGLVIQVDRLLARAADSAASAEFADRLGAARNRLGGPLRIAIAGKVKAGKSTLLNALLGEELAPTDAGECTKIVTWYRNGLQAGVIAYPITGGPERRPWSRDEGALEIDLGGFAAADVDHLEVSWPTSRLDQLTIIDTPGIASISAEVSERTHRVMAADDNRVPVADAVVYLMRHTHASDIRFLEAFHDDELIHGTVMNSIGVLSRADEIGACRLDAMEVAGRIARRYRYEPRLRRLCPIVVAVDGLLANAAVTFRQAEYQMLARLAAAPPEVTAELLLTADRFATRLATEITELEREHLLDRMGLFGVRLSVELIRTGTVGSSQELAAALVKRSGLARFSDVLARQFTARSRVLKARSALAVLTDVLRRGGCTDAAELRAAVEELAAGTHEFEEIRMLGTLRAGTLDLRPELATALDRLLGGSGHDPWSRLGLDRDADPDAVRQAALTELARWRRTAEHPLSSRAVQQAARTASRTLEGLVNRADQ
ncbi:dynamin family protein [Microlunatus sp. Gsoil 973]|uniref:dynamin family protein n=1 Tax=Microlunatus sp. Gsoil 973 TaxID=2672569 RepID=UPI0012B4745A|nr:dynamin family protein [Microlunatus sp. Gsoil 973]QGN34962.1 hypothetical protein GJV80_21435 [Microlunatus sp. Gsoil 973]